MQFALARVRAVLAGSLPLHPRLYRLCRSYVDRYNGDNDGDPHTNGEYLFLRSILPTCRVVFDVGANVGDWTAHAIAVNPALEVHSFEPSPTTFQQLLARPFPPSVHRVNCGLSDTAQVAHLHTYADEPTMNSLHSRSGITLSPTASETITLNTLDDYCDQAGIASVDLLKIDTEGHEVSVLRGATRLLETGRIRAIQFEYGGTYIDARILLKDVFDLLMPRGYRIAKLYPAGPRPVPAYTQQLETFQYQNFVATLSHAAPLR